MATALWGSIVSQISCTYVRSLKAPERVPCVRSTQPICSAQESKIADENRMHAFRVAADLKVFDLVKVEPQGKGRRNERAGR